MGGPPLDFEANACCCHLGGPPLEANFEANVWMAVTWAGRFRATLISALVVAGYPVSPYARCTLGLGFALALAQVYWGMPSQRRIPEMLGMRAGGVAKSAVAAVPRLAGLYSSSGQQEPQFRGCSLGGSSRPLCTRRASAVQRASLAGP